MLHTEGDEHKKQKKNQQHTEETIMRFKKCGIAAQKDKKEVKQNKKRKTLAPDGLVRL